jgi:nucleotide-binding universal stress UspA family protein
MGIKTILSVVTAPATAAADLTPAMAVAREQDAHLDVLCLGVDRTQTGYYYAGATAFVHQETLELADNDARDIEAAVAQVMAGAEQRWGSEGAVAQIGAIAPLVGLRAQFADLMVMSRPYGEGRGQEHEAIVEAALFDGAIPVLITPDAEPVSLQPRRVVVAWNQSSESLAAIRKALPILKGADLVDITIIDPPAHGPERSDPGGALAQWLARHGVRSEVSVLAKTLPKISDVIHRHVADSSADMVVMGGYGHSRFREAILGGATRNMLEEATVPVFMAR